MLASAGSIGRRARRDEEKEGMTEQIGSASPDSLLFLPFFSFPRLLAGRLAASFAALRPVPRTGAGWVCWPCLCSFPFSPGRAFPLVRRKVVSVPRRRGSADQRAHRQGQSLGSAAGDDDPDCTCWWRHRRPREDRRVEGGSLAHGRTLAARRRSFHSPPALRARRSSAGRRRAGAYESPAPTSLGLSRCALPVVCTPYVSQS